MIVCAVASRFFEDRPELHTRLSELARKLAFQVPARGYKSVEIVQAYLINVLWGCGPVQRYEQDQTWMLLGMAIRYVLSCPPHYNVGRCLGSCPSLIVASDDLRLFPVALVPKTRGRTRAVYPICTVVPTMRL